MYDLKGLVLVKVAPVKNLIIIKAFVIKLFHYYTIMAVPAKISLQVFKLILHRMQKTIMLVVMMN